MSSRPVALYVVVTMDVFVMIVEIVVVMVWTVVIVEAEMMAVD